MSRAGGLGSASSEMLRLQRSRLPRSGMKVEFVFSEIRAIRVPKGWDRLFFSVVSVGLGKTLVKSSKATVKNGICQWTETLQELIPVSKNESSKEFEDCVVKIVIATGMARSGVLGEAIVNLTNYMETGDSVPVSLPLKKCNSGTVLQVKIQCVAPPTKLRDDETAESSSVAENSNLDLNSTNGDKNSEVSEGSLQRKALGSTSRLLESPSKESSYSFRSPEVKPGIDERSPVVDDDEDGSARDSAYSDPPSFDSRLESADSGTHLSVNHQDVMIQQMTIPGSSKSLLQAAEETILELREESKMWERNAQKSMLDLDLLRKEFSEMSKSRADLDIELSAANVEHDSLRRQVEQLRASLKVSAVEETGMENLKSRNVEAARIVKELEEEIRFQKESNSDLSMQLRRSQESNIELVAVLQELEETVEKQNLVIENLTTIENDLHRNEMENKSQQMQLQEIRESEGDSLERATDKERSTTDEGVENLIREIEALREKVRELEEDCNELTEENLEILIKLKEAANASPQGGAPVEFSFNDYGERALSESADSNDTADNQEEEAREVDEAQDEVVEDGHEKWMKLKETLQQKDEEIGQLMECKSKLEAAVSDLEREKSKMGENLDIMRREGEITARCLQEMQSNMAALSKSVHFHVSANKSLERRLSELETRKVDMEQHASELQGEKEFMRRRLSEVESEMRRISDEKTWSEIELRELKAQEARLKDEISGLIDELSKVDEGRKLELLEMQNNMEVLRNSVDFHVSANSSLERRLSELEAEKVKSEGRAAELQEEIQHLRLEKDSIELEQQKLKSRCSDLENEVSGLKVELDRHDEEHRRELLEMQKEMLELSNSVDLHVSVNKSLEKRSSTLEAEKAVLEQRVVVLQEDKEHLHLQLSGLEMETRRISDEKVLSQTKLQELKTQCSSLENEVSRLNVELLESRIQLTKAWEECDSLRNSKLELESDAEKLIQERRSLGRLNQDLLSQCLNMESALEELRGSYDGRIAKIEELEGNISAMLENVASKERSLMAELDVLVVENEKQREDLALLNREIVCLNDKVVGLRGEREKMELKKDELELAVSEMRDELKSKEAELNELRMGVEDHKMMMAAEGKLSRQLDIQKAREDKLRTALNELELKLTVSEYERRQFAEESASRKINALKIENLQDQIMNLKKELNAVKAEKEKTEALLISVSSECTRLRSEKQMQDEMIVALNDSLAELENLKQGRMELEQKLLQAESDIAIKEELCAEAVDMRNELNRVRRENRQYHRTAQQLEEEKEQAMKRARALEDELMAIKEERRNQLKESRSSGMPKAGRRTTPPSDHTTSIPDDSFHSDGVDMRSRTLFPDAEFSSAAESDLSRRNSSDTARRSTRGGDLVPKERYERTKSSLESELRDIRERYLIMSLKYAEVEAQREDLVMKLKTNKNSRRWFS